MGTITRFEDLEIWKQARYLANLVYRVSSSIGLQQDWHLQRQLRKSAVSILSNIAEGFERDGTKEFTQFLSIAKGSCGELGSQLTVAFDQKYIGANEHRELDELSARLGQRIAKLMQYLRTTGIRGSKYR